MNRAIFPHERALRRPLRLPEPIALLLPLTEAASSQGPHRLMSVASEFGQSRSKTPTHKRHARFWRIGLRTLARGTSHSTFPSRTSTRLLRSSSELIFI